MARISSVGHIRITDIGITTVAEIGDSERIMPANYVIAVQRERAIFFQNEFSFLDWEIFFRPIVQPVVNENIKMTTINESPVIGVRNIDLFSVSSSAVFHIGSSDSLKAETRIKHIRHLLRERPQSL
ncbi:spore germination protein GerPE [Paenibacillus spongiae]|uniref:Spore germination protein GerPE n=1 Tax=Paenibacillus spongiae TaxID=2909671 RepID=A0ABY5SH13_9BACL|nr:spore germination protein GerPE [Paenibacillus spongiae]UVI33292.1 spore germination protein GerPE [Paenibacillus spongiae]